MTASLPPLSLSASSGPAVSGGNPASGGVATGSFAPMFGGRKTAAQTLTASLPLIGAAAIAGYLLLKRKG